MNPDNPKYFRPATATFDSLLTHVSEISRLSPASILSGSHIPAHVDARNLLRYLCRKYANMSHPDVARAMGGGHASSIYGNRRIEAELMDDQPRTDSPNRAKRPEEAR